MWIIKIPDPFRGVFEFENFSFDDTIIPIRDERYGVAYDCLPRAYEDILDLEGTITLGSEA